MIIHKYSWRARSHGLIRTECGLLVAVKRVKKDWNLVTCKSCRRLLVKIRSERV